VTIVAAERWRDPRLGQPRTLQLPSGTLEFHDRGDGPVLVFVHGYLVNANIWRALVPLLADRFRCITPDWPLGSHRVPVRPDADLTPPGVARLVAELLDALGLTDVILVGNDSGGAYAQLVAAHHPERLGGLVLNSCETPWCSWPPKPGGFGLLKAAARHPVAHRALYQPLRVEATWRWRNTYGWLAEQPIDALVMRSYTRPVLRDAAIRRDGRKAIGSVDAGYVRAAAGTLRRSFDRPVLCAWAADDRVFPLDHALRYARDLGAELRTIADSYTYTAEDQPQRTAELLSEWVRSR
jgi:pimeloyl-ACP methyl ester carboxylesterase